jgi:hypothetical protein
MIKKAIFRVFKSPQFLLGLVAIFLTYINLSSLGVDLKQGTRAPASIATQHVRTDAVFTLGCEAQDFSLPQDVSKVRFRVSNCSGAKPTKAIHKETGQTATIFTIKKDEYTTDYFSIPEGVSEVEFKWANSGSKVVTLIRQ